MAVGAKQYPEPSPEEMGETRRRFLAKLGGVFGASIASQLLGGNAIATALAYEPQQYSESKPGKILSQPQLTVLRHICSQVIPATDTLGAAEVDVHGFIDNQLLHCHSQAEQQMVIAVLDKLETVANSRWGYGFSNCKPQQQLAMLVNLEQATNEFSVDDRAQFKFLKGQIVFGYYTSEVGASQELVYVPVPGGFKGSVPYHTVGKNWGSMFSYF